MRKHYLTLALAFFIPVFSVMAETVTFRFTARHTCKHIAIDSLLIENLTQGGTHKLYSPDTLYTYSTTDLGHLPALQDVFRLSQNFPNPFSAYTSFQVMLPEAGWLSLHVYDLRGSLRSRWEASLEQGAHHFDFEAGGESLYILSAHTKQAAGRQIMIQLAPVYSRPAVITYGGREEQTYGPVAFAAEKSALSFAFSSGDQLRFTIYVTDEHAGFGQLSITDTPSGSKDYTFNLYPDSPDTPTVISGETSVPVGSEGLIYTVEDVPGVVYSWSVPESWSISSGQNSHAITVSAGHSGGEISVQAGNACGQSSARTLAVDVYIPKFSLSLLSHPLNTGILSGEGSYESGAQVGLTATAKTGWQFNGWKDEAGELLSNSASFTFSMPAQDKTLIAWFEPDNNYQFACGDEITFHYNGSHISHGTLAVEGLCWMDRNLGASGIPATKNDPAGFGDLFQWGRADDGHQDRQSTTTTELSSSDMPGHAHFILGTSSPYDWRNPQNDHLWFGTEGINNPCPPGWRLPTKYEAEMEQQRWHAANADGAYASPLKWTLAGFRGGVSGDLSQHTYGTFWTSDMNGIYAYGVEFSNSMASSPVQITRSSGLSVRCVKGDMPAPRYILEVKAEPPVRGVTSGGGSFEEGAQAMPAVQIHDGWELLYWTDEFGQEISRHNTFPFHMPARHITLTARLREIPPPFVCGEEISFTYGGENVSYGTISKDGLCWMDRNLGANRAAQSIKDEQAYGDLFQWGRQGDGHQDRESGIIAELSSTNWPGHASFITSNEFPFDWRSPQNDTLWQGEKGSNNPCPPGWRIPTEAELQTERDSWAHNETGAAYDSELKWTMGGSRNRSGDFVYTGSSGFVWSSTVEEHRSRYLTYSEGSFSAFLSAERAFGAEVRCVKSLPQTHSLMLEVTPENSAVVTGAGNYQAGETVMITATLVTGWKLKSWTDQEGQVVSTDKQFVFVMPDNDVVLTAGFEEDPDYRFECGDYVSFTYRGEQVIYGSMPRHGICWMDRNLGASRVPIASDDAEGAGDLFQWGRLADGHQAISSGTTETLSPTDFPGHSDFILTNNPPRDWRNPQNNELWQGEKGINNPCPPGWRVPAASEINQERISWVSNNATGAYLSPLKWPRNGYRGGSAGNVSNRGIWGSYWTSSTKDQYSQELEFSGSNAYIYESLERYWGLGVRCVRDTESE
jgi:uncharacterized protein (TIGR02145 family)